MRTPPHTIGPYQLLEKLGRGGSASVYKAVHGGSGQVVAIKISLHLAVAELDPVVVKRFRREFAFASTLCHPNLVRAHACGEVDGKLYQAIEYVPGKDLASHIREYGPLGMSAALTSFRGITQAVAYLHDKQVLHRDIKPGNVLLAEGVAKLADLGLVKNLASMSQLTGMQAGLGTMEYGAPEQFENAKDVDQRCDLYALAATFYNAVTGEFPFGTGGHLKILRRKMTNSFLPLSERWLGICPALNDVLTRALNCRRDQRPRSCAEFLEAFAIQGRLPEPVRTKNPMPGPTKGKDRRRIPRHPVSLKAVGEAMFATGRASWTATIADLSHEGCCLTLSSLLPENSYVHFQIGEESGQPESVLGRVCWVQPATGNQWLVGCKFVHALPPDRFNELLRSGTPKTVTVHTAKVG